MRSLKVEFTEEEINTIVNHIVDQSKNNDKCYERSGAEFPIKFSDELYFDIKVLINDDCDSRYVSSDIHLFTVNGFYKVESNVNFMVEDKVNKALMACYEQ